jgi:hypothetical protein
MAIKGAVRQVCAGWRSLWLVWGVACTLLMDASAARAADYLRVPAPTWVNPLVLDQRAQPPLGQVLDGLHYLLVDQQTQLEPAGMVSYRRFASRVLNARGAESAAHISIDFDPTYQTLALHAVNLYRDGRVQDRLSTSKIKVLQRETELEYRVYDGSKTVDVVLHDVRPGDLVDYAYSVRGSNPVLAGLESGRMDMQWRVPIHQLHRRLRVPADLPLHIQSNLEGIPVETTRLVGWTEHVWRANQVAPVSGQRNVPSWYSPFAMVQWSMFADWAALARWAEPLYAVPGRPSRALQKEIDLIAATHADPAKRLLAVLDFVQSEIRYLGIEMGQGSYRPRSPDTVLSNRYGDCKDKVLLAVTMLRALGVRAYPALVHTKRRQTVADLLPTPAAFNHVILKAQVDGMDYWLDPTQPPQKGSIEHIAQVNFGQALVLDGASQGLSTMPLTEASWHRRNIVMTLDVSKGYEHPAPLVIESVYQGAAADRMRQTLRNDNLADLQRSYLNFYLRYYPGLRIEKPFSFRDNERENRLTLQEYYEVPPFMPAPSDEQSFSARFRVPDMVSLLEQPDDRVRTAPYARQHPEEVVVSLSARLPESVSVKDLRMEVKDPAFEFHSQRTITETNILALSYRYRSLTDHVAPADMDAYIAHLDKARDQVGYTLRNPGTGNLQGWRQIVGLGGALAVMIFGAGALFAATCLAWGRRRSGAEESRQWSNQKLLCVGVGIFWFPPLGAVALAVTVAMFIDKKGAVAGMLMLLLCELVVIYLWTAAWRDIWLRSVARLAADPDVLSQKAQRLKLPNVLGAQPDPSASPAASNA